MNRAIISHQQRIEWLFDRKDYFQDDPRMLSEWSRYLCILVSGFIEQSVRTILLDYIGQHAGPHIVHLVRFIESELKRFSNPTFNKITDLLERFDPTLANEFRDKIDDIQHNAIDSVVDNRNKIAHGQNTGISFVTISNYFESIKTAIALLDSICNPTN